MSGRFTLTISIAPNCSAIPAAFQRRVFSVLIATRGNESAFTAPDNPDVRPPFGSGDMALGWMENDMAVLQFDFTENRDLATPPSYRYAVVARTSEPLMTDNRLEGRLYGHVGYTDPAVSVACTSVHDFLLVR